MIALTLDQEAQLSDVQPTDDQSCVICDSPKHILYSLAVPAATSFKFLMHVHFSQN